MRDLLMKEMSARWLAWLDPAGALISACALLPLGAGALFPFVAMCSWCVLARVSEISMSLVSALVLLSLSLHGSMEVPLTFYGTCALGVLPWALGEKRSDRGAALICGILWTLVAIAVPGLLPLVLLGYPRLGKLFPLYSGWTRWPGALLLGGALVWLLIRGEVPQAFLNVGDPEHYVAWGNTLVQFFLSLTLWAVIPFVGVFEIAQRQPEDLRMTWRNLPILGIIFSIATLEPEVGMSSFLVVTLPLSSILLTRWAFALHSVWLRRVYWLLLGTSAVVTQL